MIDSKTRFATLAGLLRSRAGERPEREAFVFLTDGEREGARLTLEELTTTAIVSALAASPPTARREQRTGKLKPLIFDDRNTREGLLGSGIACAPLDSGLLTTYFDAFVRTGFLPPPAELPLCYDPTVDYTRLGNTGLKVSRICLGCMTYGTPQWRGWVLDEEASRPFIRRALELGI